MLALMSNSAAASRIGEEEGKLEEEEGDLGLFSTYARGYVVGLRVGHVLGESSLS